MCPRGEVQTERKEKKALNPDRNALALPRPAAHMSTCSQVRVRSRPASSSASLASIALHTAPAFSLPSSVFPFICLSFCAQVHTLQRMARFRSCPA